MICLLTWKAALNTNAPALTMWQNLTSVARDDDAKPRPDSYGSAAQTFRPRAENKRAGAVSERRASVWKAPCMSLLAYAFHNRYISASQTTSPIFACMSKRLASYGLWSRSPQASLTTNGAKAILQGVKRGCANAAGGGEAADDDGIDRRCVQGSRE